MHPVYKAQISDNKKTIDYDGNQLYGYIKDLPNKFSFNENVLWDRLDDIVRSPKYFHLHKIDNQIFFSAVQYFREIGAEWCNLPITTLMISSPGEVYAGQKLDYTTDALPVELEWFSNNRRVFLSESSQFYLELRLLIPEINNVFSIYNSFRKEHADFCRLSEFQHIEFEGHVDFEKNLDLSTGLLRYITNSIVENCFESLEFYIGKEQANNISTCFDKNCFERITFENALKILYEDTKDERYRELSLKNFGSWEEIRLTQAIGKHAIVTHFPIMEIPFYHNEFDDSKNAIKLAENADIILYGYREVIGSGVRIADPELLRQKARIFNLPMDDYKPYLDSRKYEYKKTAGFGLGWQRYVQWLLKIPFIWEATHIPRGHLLPTP